GIISSFCLFYFIIFFKSNESLILHIISCCLLSLSTYIYTLVKNIYQLANKQVISSILLVFDVIIKVIVFYCVYKCYGSTTFSIIISLIIYSISVLIISSYLIFIRFHYSNEKNEDYYSLKVAIQRIMLMGTSGIMNVGQLQGYRPYLAYLGNTSELGILSFITNLAGTATGAVLSIINQIGIPRIYHTEGQYINKHIKLIFLVCIVLSFLSIPAGMIFFHIAEKDNFYPYLFLLPVGVLQEGSNAIIGTYNHLYNIKDGKLSIFATSGVLGFAVMAVMLSIYTITKMNVFITVALGIIFSQFCVVMYIMINTHKSPKPK
ncbi:hypothetical protein V2H77_00855, partial [Photorhabdus sp. P32]|uniref:hypothetical protein n=1 Tax=Photorhabdus sp. P32 TaxID=3117549 RepID=UPI00311B40A0